ncbi:MAG: glycoside hydrolase, partial [Lentisphaeria bacterium]|nr:glycoside hydrolase [Lentisphaeria bacterium]
GYGEVIENAFLRVTADPKSGRIDVVDKRNGQRWQQPEKAALQSTPPLTVADLGSQNKDVASAGNRIDITPAMTADAKKVDGPADCSATLFLGRAGDSLHLALTVKDDVLMPPEAGRRDWWERDSVEFWLGGTQYAIRAVTGRVEIVNTNGTAMGIFAEVKRLKDGYHVAAALPLSLAIKLPVKPGQTLPFALGINDCDSEAGREGQLYYPRTWVHSQPSTFLPLLLAPAPDQAKAVKAEVAPAFQNFTALPEKDGWSWQASSSDGPLRAVHCRLVGAELQFTESAIGDDAMKRSIPSTRGFILDSPDGALLVADYSNGHLYPLNETPFRRPAMSGGSTLDMPWIGIMDMARSCGYAFIIDTPDDAHINMAKIDLANGCTHVPQLSWVTRKGHFGPDARSYRFYFTDRGGYVDLAKHWRGIAKDMGYLVTLKEKAARNPNVYKLMGAADIWGGGSLAFAQAAKAHGIDKLLINGPASPDATAAMNDLGYLTGRYDNYTDILPLRENEGVGSARGRIPEDCVMEQDQSRRKAWLTFDKKTQYMKRCPALWVPSAQIVMPKDLAKMPYNTRFIDVTTAESLYECYDPEHPLDRTAKRRCGEDLLAYVSETLNLVSGGEHGRWWGVKSLHYLEGMMSGGYYSWPAGHLLRPKTKDHNLREPEKPTDRFALYEKYGIGHETRLPLWELVFHDCISSTWYWGDATDYLLDAAPEVTAKKDAFNILYGSMPLYWVNHHGLWQRDRRAFLRSYFHVSKMHETVGMAEMLNHEFLSADRALQRTTFSDGTIAVVNFAPEVRVIELAGESYALPQNGFAVVGPTLRQSLVVRDGMNHSEISCGDFLFRSAMAADGSGELSVMQAKKLAPDQLQLTSMGKDLTLPTRHLGKRSFFAKLFRRPELPGLTAYRLDTAGNPEALIDVAITDADIAIQGDGSFLLLWGAAARQPDLVLGASTAKEQYLATEQPAIAFTISNAGRQSSAASLRIYADAVAPERMIGQAVIAKIPVGGSVTQSLTLDLSRLAGRHRLIADLTTPEKYHDLMPINNRSSWPCKINLDLKDFSLQKTISVQNGDIDRVLEPVTLKVDFAPLLDKKATPILADNVHVFQKLANGSYSLVDYAQFTPAEGFDGLKNAAGDIDFCYSAPAGGSSVFVIAANQSSSLPLTSQGTGFQLSTVKHGEGSYQGDNYALAFRDGIIMDLMPAGPQGAGPDFLVSLVVSSASTGWAREEQADLKRFELLKNGPALTELVVAKTLRNGVNYTKTYKLWPGRFTVIVSLDKAAGGLYSRGFYCADADFLDDKGNRTRMGLGEGSQGIYNANKNPQWFALRGDGWAQSCVATTTVFENIAFWDSKGDTNKGQIGFTSNQIDQLHYTYFVHDQQADFEFATKDYQRAKYPAKVAE